MPGIGNLGDLIVRIIGDPQPLGRGLTKASSMIRDWSIVVTALTGGISNAFKTIATVGIKAVTVALAGLGASFVAISASGIEFQDNMFRAFAVLQESAGATERDLEKLTLKAKEMGSETLFSANQAAEGFGVLARAGFETKEIIESIKPVVDLAIVGNIGVSQSANIAATTMRGFGLEAEELSSAVDQMAKASVLANTNIELLNSSMSFVAPVASLAGLSLSETAASIGVLANAGIRGSRGGTTLRRMISVLIAPTGRAKEEFDRLGLSFINSSGKMDSMAVALRKLERAGLDAGQIMKIFGLRGGPGVAALLAQGSGALIKMTKDIEDSEGAADRMSQKLRESVGGRLKDLTSSLKLFGLSLFENFSKPLADTLFGIRNYVKGLTEALTKTGFFKELVKGVINALSPLGKKIEEVAKKLRNMLVGLSADDISVFFEGIKQKIEDFISFITSGDFIENIKALFEGAKAAVMIFVVVMVELFNILGKAQGFFGKLAIKIFGFVAAINLLMGGLVPLGALIIFSGILFKGLAARILSTMAAMFGLKIQILATNAVQKKAIITSTVMGDTLVIGGKKAGFFGKMLLFVQTRLLGLLKTFAIWGSVVVGTVSVVLVLVAALKGLGTLIKGKGFSSGFTGFFKEMKGGIGVLIDGIKSKMPKLFSGASDSAKKAAKEANDELKNIGSFDLDLENLDKQFESILKKMGIKKDKIEKTKEDTLKETADAQKKKEEEAAERKRTRPARRAEEDKLIAQGIRPAGSRIENGNLITATDQEEFDEQAAEKSAEDNGKLLAQISKKSLEPMTNIINEWTIQLASFAEKALIRKQGLGDGPDGIFGKRADESNEALKANLGANIPTGLEEGVLGGVGTFGKVRMPSVGGAITESKVDAKIKKENAKLDENLAVKKEEEISALSNASTGIVNGLDRVSEATGKMVDGFNSFQEAALEKLHAMEQKIDRLETQGLQKVNKDKIATVNSKKGIQ